MVARTIMTIVALIAIILAAVLLYGISIRFDTTHLSNEMVECPVRIVAGNQREFVYFAEAPFVQLRLRILGQFDSHIRVRMKNENGKSIIDGEFSTIDAKVNTRYGGRELLFFDSGERYPNGTYYIIIENIDGDPVDVLTVFDDSSRISLYSEDVSYIGVIIAFVCLVISSVFLVSVFVMIRKKVSIKRFFVISAILLSFTYLVLFLPQDCPDSESHFPAIYRWSNIMLGIPEEDEWMIRMEDFGLMSNFVHRTYISPASYDKYFSGITYNNHDLTLTENGTEQNRMKFYSVFCYLPQVIGLSIGRILHMNGFLCVLISRIFMMVFYIVGCFYAIKIIPVGKEALAVICLMPFSILYSTALSYDGVLFVLAMLFISISFRFSSEQPVKYVFFLSMLTFLLGAVKAGTGLMLVPLLFINCDKTSIIKRMIPLVIGIVSIFLFDFILPQGSFFQMGGDERMMEASYAFAHPGKYLCMMFLGYAENIMDILSSRIIYRQNHFLGDSLPYSLLELLLSPSDISYKAVIYACTPVLISAAFYLVLILLKYQTFMINKSHIIIMSITIVLYYILTPIMLLSATYRGSNSVSGLQGRYYLVLLIIEALLIKNYMNSKSKINSSSKNRFKILIESKNINNSTLLCVLACLSFASVYCFLCINLL